MARHDFADVGSFGAVSLLERRRADQFFNDLVGSARALRQDASEDAPPDAPTITLSTSEVLVCVGGVNNAAITATTTGSGTVTWTIEDPTRASVTAAANTATIRGKYPGVTKIKATLTSGSTTVTATARLLVIFVQLLCETARPRPSSRPPRPKMRPRSARLPAQTCSDRCRWGQAAPIPLS